jgi:arylsulfatase
MVRILKYMKLGFFKNRITLLLLSGSVLISAAFLLRFYFEPPKSVILITVDTLRADHTSLHGYKEENTPVLKQLASRGASFLDAYSASSSTAPSHASIFTGLYPSWHTVGLYNGQKKLHPSTETLAEILNENGCRTIAIVSNPVLWASLGLNQGFEVYDDKLEEREKNRGVPERYARRAINIALAWLEIQHEPFFMWIHLQDPHGPYTPVEKFSYTEKESISKGLSLPAGRDHSGYKSIPKYQIFGTERRISDYVYRYDCEIANTDYQLGRLFAYLKKEKWFRNTLIILTADHGEALGEDDFYFAHGHSVGADQVHVPLIIAGRGIPRGMKIDSHVSNISIFKTVLDYMGMDVPSGKHGNSLLSFDPEQDNEPVFVESINQVGVFYNNIFFRKDRIPKDNKDFWLRGNPNSSGGIWVPLPEDEVRSLVSSGKEINFDDVKYLKKELAFFEEEAAKARVIVESLRRNVTLTPGQIKQLQSLGYLK